MFKKLIACLTILLLFIPHSISLAEGGTFATDPDRIEKAAQSVLMLEVYESRYSMIATGSGFVAFDSGTIVTNYHVIEDAEFLIGYSDTGSQYRITTVLVASEEKDIAICGFEEVTDLTPLEFDADRQLKRAETVVAIGSPIGITNTVSLGNVSAIYTEDDVSWVQFTAPISHGSSGGALFDDEGRVIGVTSASYVDTQNLNLAVHISEVQALYDAWDGSHTPFEEYLNGSYVSLKPTIRPDKTPKPTGTPKVTPKPTKTPKPTGTPKVTPTPTKTPKPTATPKPTTPPKATPKPTAKVPKPTNPAKPTASAPSSKDNDISAINGGKISSGSLPEYAALKRGDRGDAVRHLQQALIDLGYLNHSADGFYGLLTEQAVQLFNDTHNIRSGGTASSATQQLLFHGDPIRYEDPAMALVFTTGSMAEYLTLNGNRADVRFEVRNVGRNKAVKSFELYVYALDVWGNEVYGDTIYHVTTQRTVSPGSTAYSDYITIPSWSRVDRLYCGIHKVVYTDGTTCTQEDIEYFYWTFD